MHLKICTNVIFALNLRWGNRTMLKAGKITNSNWQVGNSIQII